ncbi:cellulose binding domain-containing protein [Streptomyces sp. HPF1205]|uniref:cellulose binding domain-containing protein n=1 Tax=Streptomyces sp. HPF1205 TaxID=2873262 RepID=UPI001CEC5903|nr:cellulose binding domain-containing protein [Streptomyces sp. HPF1205]
MALPSRRWGGAALATALTAAAAVTAVAGGATSAAADTGALCGASYTIAWQTPSDSPPDFGVTVTVTNKASYAINSWSVSWAYAAGQKIIAGSPYSANVTQSGTTVTATPLGSNANLAPGASTTFGFHATYDGTSNPVPAVTCAGPSQGSSRATLSGSLDPLGVNTAAWDTDFTAPAIADDLSSADVGLIRYPGGSWADQYMWQTNTVKGATQPVDFGAYSTQVDAVTKGQKFVTINYGSDTPDSAAAWVKQSQTPGQGVSLWEIGNEVYGSWETDNHSGAHTASSYATNGLAYMKAMKAADPKARICYDYAMDGSLAPGAGVDGWQDWNNTVLQADAAYIDCADVHWYPINGTPPESVQSIMETVDNIPAAAAEIHAALSANDPTADFVVGETNISQTANEWNEEPVGALFSAANTMEWLSYGAQSVDGWDVHNYGTPTADFGMFSSGTGGEPAVNTPYPPYYGFKLAAQLAVPGATVGTLPQATPNLYTYYSQLPDGSYAVMLVNADPSASATVSTAGLGITSSSETSSTYDSANPAIATGTASGSSVTVPAESIVTLTHASGAPPTATGDTTPPSAPTGLKVTGTTSSSVSLSWTAATDNVGVTGYDVYRGTTLAGTTATTTFTDSGLTASTPYTYTVKAKDAAGNVSAASAAVTATTQSGTGGDTTPPSAPTGLKVTGTTSSSVSLSWTASTDNVGVTGYDVYRGTTLAGSTATTTFTDSGLTASTQYSYTVKAKDAAGNVSAASGSVTATTQSGSTGGGALKVQYKNNDSSPTDNQIKPGLNLVNTGTSAVSLSTVTIRYWFTGDGGSSFSTYIDYAALGSSNITTKVVSTSARTGADHYLEVGFTSGAGSLAAGKSTGDIQSRLNKSDWSNFNETNDYSYGTNTSYADAPKITVYIGGTLAYGTEPS